LASGQPVAHLYEIFLLIFADLKKHTFTYQFYSTAVPVKNYKILKWEKCSAEFEVAKPINGKEVRSKLSDHLKLISKETVVPQFTVLNANYDPSSIT
jgi:hypothetical protein